MMKSSTEEKIAKVVLEDIAQESLIKAVDYAAWMIEQLSSGDDVFQSLSNTVDLAVKHIGIDIWFLSQPLIAITQQISEQTAENIKKVFSKPLGIGENKQKIEFSEKAAEIILIAAMAKYVKEMLGDLEIYRAEQLKKKEV